MSCFYVEIRADNLNFSIINLSSILQYNFLSAVFVKSISLSLFRYFFFLGKHIIISKTVESITDEDFLRCY